MDGFLISRSVGPVYPLQRLFPHAYPVPALCDPVSIVCCLSKSLGEGERPAHVFGGVDIDVAGIKIVVLPDVSGSGKSARRNGFGGTRFGHQWLSPMDLQQRGA